MNFYIGVFSKCCRPLLNYWETDIYKYFPLNLEESNNINSDLIICRYSEEKIKCIAEEKKIFIDGYVNFKDSIINNSSEMYCKTELMNYIYQCYKNKKLGELNLLGGSFLIVFCINEEIFILNDNIASKKLYYYENDGKILFANDLRLLLCNTNIPYEINEEQCRLFCTSLYAVQESSCGNSTFFKDIYKLNYGTLSVISNDKIKQLSYFEHYDVNSIKYLENDENNYFRKTLNDVNFGGLKDYKSNIGISLSGGIDSSVVLASLIDIGKKNDIIAYHVSFKNSNLHQCSDHFLVKKMVKDLGIKAKILYADDTLRFKNSEIGRDKLSYIDGPASLGNELVYDYLAPIIKEDGVKKMYTGDGGDYLFMGTKYCGDYFMRKGLYREALCRSNHLANTTNVLKRINSYFKYNIVPMLPILSDKMYKKIFWENDEVKTPEYLSKKIHAKNKSTNYKKILKDSKPIKDWYRRFVYDFMYPRGQYVDVNVDSFDFCMPLEDNMIFRAAIAIPGYKHYDIYAGLQGDYAIRKKVLRNSYDDILPTYISKQKKKTMYGNMFREIIYNDRKNILHLFENSKCICEDFDIIDGKKFYERLKLIACLSEDVNFTGGFDVNYYTNIIKLEIWLRTAMKGRHFILSQSQLKFRNNNNLILEDV